MPHNIYLFWLVESYAYHVSICELVWSHHAIRLTKNRDHIMWSKLINGRGSHHLIWPTRDLKHITVRWKSFRGTRQKSSRGIYGRIWTPTRSERISEWRNLRIFVLTEGEVMVRLKKLDIVKVLRSNSISAWALNERVETLSTFLMKVWNITIWLKGIL